MTATEKDIAANLLMRGFFGIDDMYDVGKSSQEQTRTGSCTVCVSDAIPAISNDGDYIPLDFKDTETKTER